MAETTLLQNSFHLGMRRDKARSNMPPGSLWNAVDVILDYGAPVRQRGGWVHHSQDISSVTAGVDNVLGGIYVTFSNSAGGTTTKNLAIAHDAGVSTYLMDVTTANVASLVSGSGVVSSIVQNPVFHGGTAASAATAVFTGLVIIPFSPSTPVRKYDGTTFSQLGGSPPQAYYSTVYKDYTVLGNGTVGSTHYPDRIWFSPEGDPDCAVSAVTAWDTTDSWIGLSQHVKGLGATRNALLVFHEFSTTRIRGSIPPPDEDMVVDDQLFQVGLLDPFSIANHRDTLIWASEEGVFRTDGAILDDLTRRGGMIRYWNDLTAAATSAWTFAGGVIRDTYFLSIMNGSTFMDCFAIDLASLAWTRLSNVDATSFWSGQNNKADELYWGRKGAPRVSRLGTIYQVGDSTYKLDGDGDAVLPVVETPFYQGNKLGPKRFRRAFLQYELTDYATDNPLCSTSYILTPEETSYTSAGSLAETTQMERVAIPIQKQAQGIGFKVSRSSGAGDFLLYTLEMEGTPYTQSRRI